MASLIERRRPAGNWFSIASGLNGLAARRPGLQLNRTSDSGPLRTTPRPRRQDLEMSQVVAEDVKDRYDLVVIGSGFGSSFYLAEARRLGVRRILVLEWGNRHEHAWQLEQRRHSDIVDLETYVSASAKPWRYTVGFGGGMNCWYAQTPRFHPTDFELRTRYGVGEDWPFGYDQLEPYYAAAEAIMSVSGDPDMARIMPRSTPFPQPPHRMSSPDRMMKAARPDSHFVMPTARARMATDTRNACCASLRCYLCPADAKFTAQNGFSALYEDPEISLCVGARAVRFETEGGEIRSLVFESDGRSYSVSADRFILGANAIQSPAILLRSGLDHPATGLGLHESYGASIEVMLDGLDNLDGSTITTGLDFSLYDGPHRREAGAAAIHFENHWYFGLRNEPGRLRQTLPLFIVTEDLLEPENRVRLDAGDPDGHPVIDYVDASDYAKRGMERALAALPKVLEPLPVEDIVFREYRPTESHIQGTLRMGADPARSVVDADQVHHRWRNLTIVGSAVFASCSCANPSLTVAALSLRAARRAGTGA